MRAIPLLRRQFYPFTPIRLHRVKQGVTLTRALAHMEEPLSLARASEIERCPTRARPGELERLLAGVDRAAAEGILND